MREDAYTIGQTIDQLHEALRDYIEAAYHISHPVLIAQRRRLLDEKGVISQRPFLESTPRYEPGPRFADLGLEASVLDMFSLASSSPDGQKSLIHDPPYQHQAKAVVESLVNHKSLVIMTGTGSGKTECFLLPILGKLAREARRNDGRFADYAAVRAILLYPMNALVNDQLGRLRLLFGDKRITGKFHEWSGRPARFARYTSRTLYPGVRSVEKDQERLRPLEDFYIRYLEQANAGGPEAEASRALIKELQDRGKWPAKPDMMAWYGEKGSRWTDSQTGGFKRCVTLPNDPELLTRHEVLDAPPDVLVTNYSMLEYMLMRPLERPIFDSTREWLERNPDETLMLVVDEAHLYRGASGTEVALLLRRLRERLGIPPERLQVICTSASFRDSGYAVTFGAELTGKSVSDFAAPITGELALRERAAPGSPLDAQVLAAIDLTGVYYSGSDSERLSLMRQFLALRQVTPAEDLQTSIYEALADYPPMSYLINLTMQDACPVDALGATVFPGTDKEEADRAVAVLVALGSLARRSITEPGLLPCRVHSFHRGLPGLWACVDPGCSALDVEERDGPTGKLYSQPRDVCECGARVFELYTCRNCGTAYARAYSDNVESPDYLWSEQGGAFRTLAGHVEELQPLDILLESPVREGLEIADLDLVTGRLNPRNLGSRTRSVFLRPDRTVHHDAGAQQNPQLNPGEFRPCAVCSGYAGFGRSSVQDHQTKGDQPFQALIGKQLQVQPPNLKQPTRLAPLCGRKVLVFSDSRQTAARLAPNLQSYSAQDALRPLIVTGYLDLQSSQIPKQLLSLDDIYLALLIAASRLRVRLRPELKTGESFSIEAEVDSAVKSGALNDLTALLGLQMKLRASAPPESLMRSMWKCLEDRWYGLGSLALASIAERTEHTSKIEALPDIPGIAETIDSKVAIARAWLDRWLDPGIWLGQMPHSWWGNGISGGSGSFRPMNNVINTPDARRVFERQWLPELLRMFTEQVAANTHKMRGSELTLSIGGEWGYCQTCKTTQRPIPGHSSCLSCGNHTVVSIDPDRDPVFVARKGYYRASAIDALRDPSSQPMSIIAAEHTAQLNAAQVDQAFSVAEEHELLFQDVDLGPQNGNRERPAIDVLSCTTTMEVGIDIGNLSGVSLRNMPPARANYQQRAGRAGRRGNAIATVTAFGSADSHDEHYFSHPDQMIRGQVDDPTLTLDNSEIARRHMTAYLLQRYHQDRLPHIRPEDQPHLFAVLGKVAEFMNPTSQLSRADLSQWLVDNQSVMRGEIESWLPEQIPEAERGDLLAGIVTKTLDDIDKAIGYKPRESAGEGGNESAATTQDGTSAVSEQEQEDGSTSLEVAQDEDDDRSAIDPASENLLDRLLYKGVLPRYAFPTDVATFHVFDPHRSTRYRPKFRFTPSQGLSAALSQYAPGKEVWIDGRLWTSGAVYSPIKNDRYRAWDLKRLYYECSVCHYARTVELPEGEKGECLDCPACGNQGTFGAAKYWLRPPGFAHPVDRDEGTSPDDPPAKSYATRAKLIAPTPSDPTLWNALNPKIREHSTREHLLVTNSGPRQEGYSYCTKCGRIEPTALPVSQVSAIHRKPYPDDREPNCPGGAATRGMVLGTDFISDVLLVSVKVEQPTLLLPGYLTTDVALRTVCEALAKAGSSMLELEPTELQAEYRPALTLAGQMGEEAEIYLYDTLPGGAGFSRRVGRLGLGVFEEALRILESCPDACDSSCYRCLRSYKNKFEHDLLDRHLGASLLRLALSDEKPQLNSARAVRSIELLYQDLLRQQQDGYTFERDKIVSVAGVGDISVPILGGRSDGSRFAVCLLAPFTRDEPSTEQLRVLKEYSAFPVYPVDELIIRRNLPWVTTDLMNRLGRGGGNGGE